MFVPKARLCPVLKDDQVYYVEKYYVWDTDNCGFVENRSLSQYDTKEECQEAIDFYNSLSVIKVS